MVRVHKKWKQRKENDSKAAVVMNKVAIVINEGCLLETFT